MPKKSKSCVLNKGILLYFPSGTSVTQNPDYACEGEDVTVSCVQTVPNDGYRFTSREISFVIGNNILIFKHTIKSNALHGMDLSRFTADTPLGNSTYVTGSITLLSFNSSTDENLRMGCDNKIRASGASMSEYFARTLRLDSAGMYRDDMINIQFVFVYSCYIE